MNNVGVFTTSSNTNLQFDIPITYPATAPELELPEIDGKTQKVLVLSFGYDRSFVSVSNGIDWLVDSIKLVEMKVTVLNPRFGIAHALCLGLAAEIPILVDSGMIKHKDDAAASSAES
ncbi:unnamed protein product [Eruca vesicaria subsp. sativa]|uniref:Ubiquitin-fold modifier-conjugating enzyme 1 n=1 Tax=Eruca vesicaria subsp. sativa TaxID=29727 RepID=A0ABC8LDR1_ERUVS|nr:unnamed protein product [Eruca vesicaria subsp. sativa]